MMVLVIIGLMSSAVVMTIPRQQSTFERSIQALTVQMNGLSERSIMTASPTALGLSESSYYFYEYQDAQWTEVKIQDWPQDVTVELKKNGRTHKILEDVETPQLIFQPTGITTPFEILFTSPEFSYYISSPGFGEITRATFKEEVRGR